MRTAVAPKVKPAALSAQLLLRYGSEQATRLLDLTAGHRTIATQLKAGNAAWTCYVTPRRIRHGDGFTDLQMTLRLDAGIASQSTIGLAFEIAGWSNRGYLFMPAAVYGGNRFDVVQSDYPPMYEALRNDGPATAAAIAHGVPGLSTEPAAISEIQQLSRDLATPAAGFYMPETRRAFLLIAEPTCGNADVGFVIRESAHCSGITLELQLPGRRPSMFYDAPWRRKHPRREPWQEIALGHTITFALRVAEFEARDVHVMFDRFFAARKSPEALPVRAELPFSAAFEIQERKFVRENWNAAHDYISVNTDGNWQTGWCGGLMSSHALLLEGGDNAREQAMSTIAFAFKRMQAPSGLFYGVFQDGRVMSDGRAGTLSENWHLVRRSADALYFLMKQLLVLRDRDATIPATWLEGTRRCADALARLWKRNGQFGQYVDFGTGEIVIGGTTSGGIAPAGLALAAQFFNCPDYLKVAEAAADDFFARFVQQGLTTGGPGDALAAPDSESAFGLLESYVTLYEVTGERRWIEPAEHQARQCATWVTSYDYALPPDSTFGKLRMQTQGAVWANVQNKHGAPGICTLSGVSLFKLFRASGDIRYLELIRDIARAIPQFLSRTDRPVGKLPEGWMCERVNLSDWMEPSGEIFNGSCWCEVSLMLSYAELPGVYVNPDLDLVCALDHLEASLAPGAGDPSRLVLHNPTTFPARVKVWSELSHERSVVLGQNFLGTALRVTVPAGGSVAVPLPSANEEVQ